MSSFFRVGGFIFIIGMLFQCSNSSEEIHDISTMDFDCTIDYPEGFEIEIQSKVNSGKLILFGLNQQDQSEYHLFDIESSKKIGFFRSYINDSAFEIFSCDSNMLYTMNHIKNDLYFKKLTGSLSCTKFQLQDSIQMFPSDLIVHNNIVYFLNNMYGFYAYDIITKKYFIELNDAPEHSLISTISRPLMGNGILFLGHVKKDSLFIMNFVNPNLQLVWSDTVLFRNNEMNRQMFEIQTPVTSLDLDSVIVNGMFNYLEVRNKNDGILLNKIQIDGQISRLFKIGNELFVFAFQNKQYSLMKILDLSTLKMKKEFAWNCQSEKMEIYAIKGAIYVKDGYDIIKYEDQKWNQPVHYQLNEENYSDLKFLTDEVTNIDYLILYNPKNHEK